MTKTTNEPIICECGHDELRHGTLGCGVSLGDCYCTKTHGEVLRSRLSTLEAAVEEAKKLIDNLEGVACGAVEHVAVANYPERERQAIHQIEFAFDKARKALAETAPKVQS
jgi:hypothetical protein